MVDFPHSWAGEWAGRSVVVVGSGDVGFAMADTLHELGCDVAMVTDTPGDDPEKILGVLGVHLVANEGSDTLLPEGFVPELAVLASPVWRSHPVAQAVADSGGAVWSEVEFSFRVADRYGSRPRFVFLAGHRAGDPVSQLASALCWGGGLRAVTVGSLGQTALDAIRDPAQWEMLIWPLGINELHDLVHDTDPLRSPFVSLALDGDSTLTAKAMDAVYFRTEYACIYSRGGGPSERALEEAWVEEGARAIGVGLDSPGMSDLGIVDDIVCDRAFLDDRRHRALELTTLGELERVGISTPQDVTWLLAACAIARAVNVSPEDVGEAIRRLKPGKP